MPERHVIDRTHASASRSGAKGVNPNNILEVKKIVIKTEHRAQQIQPEMLTRPGTAFEPMDV
jgi:hypothetical protein